jgi:alpha-glucosidase
MLVGEIYLPVERLVMYYGEGGQGVHMPFNFQLITMPWNAGEISHAIQHYEKSLPNYGWPNWVLGNHDNPRIASRVGRPQARVAAMMLLTLRGTPTMYYGDEIGMCDVCIPKERVQDPFEKNVPGMGLGRDPERTPMQWDSSPNAGFTTGQPWLPLAADFPTYNVAAERDDPASMLTLVRQLLALRRATPALSAGTYTDIPTGDPNVFAFLRTHEGQRMLVVLNFSHAPGTVRLTGIGSTAGIALSTVPGRTGPADPTALALAADEGVILRL